MVRKMFHKNNIPMVRSIVACQPLPEVIYLFYHYALFEIGLNSS
jgi:hypothetical protein